MIKSQRKAKEYTTGIWKWETSNLSKRPRKDTFSNQIWIFLKNWFFLNILVVSSTRQEHNEQINAFSLVFLMVLCGTVSRACLLDLRERLGLWIWTSSARYDGASPALHLKQRVAILYLIRASTGSQCNCLSMGVMWSLFFFLRTRRAEWFWIFWSLLKVSYGRP